MQPSDAVATHFAYLYKIPCDTFKAGFTQFAFLFANSSSETFNVIVLFTASIAIKSPSSTNAIVPPSIASGVICPTTKPCEPPEKRPSVIKATLFPKPAPMIAEVGFNISGIPGPPFGPHILITTTVPS